MRLKKTPLWYGGSTVLSTFNHGTYDGNDYSSDCSAEEAFVEVVQPHQLIRPTSTHVQQRDLGVRGPQFEYLPIDDIYRLMISLYVSSTNDLAKSAIRAESTQIGNPHMHKTQGLPNITNDERVQMPKKPIDELYLVRKWVIHNVEINRYVAETSEKKILSQCKDDHILKARNTWKAYSDKMQYKLRQPMYQLQDRPFPKKQERQNRNAYYYLTPGLS